MTTLNVLAILVAGVLVALAEIRRELGTGGAAEPPSLRVPLSLVLAVALALLLTGIRLHGAAGG